MGVHQIKMALIEEFPGLQGLIMRYQPGTGDEAYTATIDGQNVEIIVPAGTMQDDAVAIIAAKLRPAEKVDDAADQ